jgi:hypothetical protein
MLSKHFIISTIDFLPDNTLLDYILLLHVIVKYFKLNLIAKLLIIAEQLCCVRLFAQFSSVFWGELWAKLQFICNQLLMHDLLSKSYLCRGAFVYVILNIVNTCVCWYVFVKSLTLSRTKKKPAIVPLSSENLQLYSLYISTYYAYSCARLKQMLLLLNSQLDLYCVQLTYFALCLLW